MRADPSRNSDVIGPSGSPAIHPLLVRFRDNAQRRELTRLRQMAHEMVYGNSRHPKETSPEAIMDKIGEANGICVIERRESAKDRNKCHCVEWVFQENLHQDVRGTLEFWNTVIESLAGVGYFPTKTPRAGDIAIYGFQHPKGLVGKHIGLLQENGRIRSKFEAGHVFEHDQKIVPSEYGNSILFFTKKL